MTSRSIRGLIAMCALALCGCVMGTQRVSPNGRIVTVVPTREGGGAEASGELLAIDTDSLWVRVESELVALPLTAVDRVAVRRHGLDAGKGLLWAVAGGVVTGGALAVACSSVEDADCSGVFTGVLGSWLVIGGLSAATLGSSSKLVVTAPGWEQLRPYARFPQGLPVGFDQATLYPSR